MTEFATSADGTRIAFDQLGDGPPLIIAAGIFCDRSEMEPLAEELSTWFTVINFDRRGRGESGDTAPYTAEREVEDIAALIAELGGSAALYGHSSGAGLALNAAAAGLPISRLILHEPPYSADDESKAAAREMYLEVQRALNEDRRGDAIAMFFKGFGMPPEVIEDMKSDDRMLRLAGTMHHDFEIMGDNRGEGVPDDRVKAINVPTLVMCGSESPDFFGIVADRIAELLPNGKQTVLMGQDHGAAADVVAPVIAEYLLLP